MLKCVRVPVGSRESKIDQLDLTSGGVQTKEKTVRLDIAVDQVMSVNMLKSICLFAAK